MSRTLRLGERKGLIIIFPQKRKKVKRWIGKERETAWGGSDARTSEKEKSTAF